jgi:hypothetical protein
LLLDIGLEAGFKTVKLGIGAKATGVTFKEGVDEFISGIKSLFLVIDGDFWG